MELLAALVSLGGRIQPRPAKHPLLSFVWELAKYPCPILPRAKTELACHPVDEGLRRTTWDHVTALSDIRMFEGGDLDPSPTVGPRGREEPAGRRQNEGGKPTRLRLAGPLKDQLALESHATIAAF